MLIFAVILTFFMLTVMITDLTRFIIPNWLVGAMLLLYPILVFTAPVKPDWKMALLIALGMFAFGYVLFAMKAMGGGDVKLLAVTALFAGVKGFFSFIVGVGMLGGLLALVLVIVRPIIGYLLSKMKKPPAIPRIFTVGEPVPYGLAIATSFLILLWSGEIPGIPLHL